MNQWSSINTYNAFSRPVFPFCWIKNICSLHGADLLHHQPEVKQTQMNTSGETHSVFVGKGFRTDSLSDNICYNTVRPSHVSLNIQIQIHTQCVSNNISDWRLTAAASKILLSDIWISDDLRCDSSWRVENILTVIDTAHFQRSPLWNTYQATHHEPNNPFSPAATKLSWQNLSVTRHRSHGSVALTYPMSFHMKNH